MGISHVLFADTEDEVVKDLQGRCKKINLVKKNMPIHMEVKKYIQSGGPRPKITLDMQGTDFQKKVWKVLQNISSGKTSTYKEVAIKIGDPKAVRAVGTAIGANPIGFIVPCHRVLTSSGGMGGFRWGIPRKMKMLEVEKR